MSGMNVKKKTGFDVILAALFCGLLVMALVACTDSSTYDPVVDTEAVERDGDIVVVVVCTGGPGTGGYDNCRECNGGGTEGCCAKIEAAGAVCEVLCDHYQPDKEGTPNPRLCAPRS